MAWIGTLQRKSGEALFAAARNSQALVIEALDRTARVRGRRELPLLNRISQLQHELVSLLLDDPAQFVDDGYQVLQQLTSLHREFAQRLFEVVDPRDLDVKVTSVAATGQVLPFPTRWAATS